MALEMKVHKDIAAYEAKPMFGLTWRRIGALAIMIFGGGTVFFVVTTAVLVSNGGSWNQVLASGALNDPAVLDSLSGPTNAGMYAMFPFIVPVAFWAWWRPMGLTPEVYIQYFFRHVLTTKVITYEDTYQHTSIKRNYQSVSEHGDGQLAKRSKRHRQPEFKEARLARSLSEHSQGQERRTRRSR